MEVFNKELGKLFKLTDAQKLQDPEKVSTIWVKNLNKTVNKMNNTESSMTGMKPKDAIKLDTVPPNKTYPKETVLPEDGLYRIFINLMNNMETKKADNRPHLKLKYVSVRSNCTRPRYRVLYYLQDGPDRAFVCEELMHVCEDT